MSLTGTFLRSCTCRFLAAKPAAGLGLPHAIDGQQRRTIVTKNMLVLPDDHAAREPWPYQEKGYSWFHAIYDRTQKRFNTNSKLITVEGNIGCEKSSFAKELADRLGFYYIPEFKMEKLLIDRYGQDLRDFYHLFPKRFRFFDDEMFYKDPMSDMTAVMRDFIFKCRFDELLNAVAHILNTGQGVVLENCIYSDLVYANAMRAKNYIGPEYFKRYYYIRKRALPQLFFWPHLVIYLDTPVSVCLENVRKEGNVNKANTIDETYLQTIAESYKDVLTEAKRQSKILVYDWSKPGDVDTVIEDIEAIDFDFFEWHSGDVFETWHTPQDEMAWTERRIKVTNKYAARVITFDNIPVHEAGELYINPRDAAQFINVMITQVLKSRYGYGYNKERGDPPKGFWAFRTGHTRPEPWYDYYLREAWLDNAYSHETLLYPDGETYDPDYLHSH
ncbi:unnamed protein product [Enterobius vermicularis]|uniref:NADH dehydrogenase [ubiquinone] 1 alpha subcomplex subunit 10, mitochondrial n=1 Tax=Enterobius vermicularis TaxID=51028 RepID=A0A0N4VAS0_ENTVE|nr:unnamed protein product [Enterobius vermicularis]